MKKKILRAAGDSILIKIIRPPERVSAGGIVLAGKGDEERSMAQRKEADYYGQFRGHVVDVGPDAYRSNHSKWCKVGDEVYFNNKGARAISDENWYGNHDLDENSPPTLREILDEDIIGIFQEIETNE